MYESLFKKRKKRVKKKKINSGLTHKNEKRRKNIMENHQKIY